MKVSDYVEVVKATDKKKGDPDGDLVRTLGLVGEIGSLLTEIKKTRREGVASPQEKQRICEELGDILWYVTAIANSSKLDLWKDVLVKNLTRVLSSQMEPGDYSEPVGKLKGLGDKQGVGKEIKGFSRKVSGTFKQYQDLAIRTSRHKTKEAVTKYAIQMWSNSSKLLSQHGVFSSEGATSAALIPKALGDVLWYVANLAKVYKLDLDEVAKENKLKVKSWVPGDDRSATPLFDKDCHELERFPRKFTIEFIPKPGDVAVMKMDGVLVGDPLTDNAYKFDAYRYHDVIHLAFVAILGWSPVFRGLIHRKRKSCAKKQYCERPEKCGRVDEVEDGARARVVEEAIVKIAHSYAEGFGEKLLKGQDTVSFDLLKQCKKLTEGLEANACKFWEWQEAILKGFEIYSILREEKDLPHTVDINLDERTIKLRAGK